MIYVGVIAIHVGAFGLMLAEHIRGNSSNRMEDSDLRFLRKCCGLVMVGGINVIVTAVILHFGGWWAV